MKRFELLHKTIFTLIVLVSSLTTVYADHPALSGGYGDEDNPYLISKPSDLVDLSDWVNGDESDDEVFFYKMTADIDMSGIKFTPINNYKNAFDNYSCNFDGDGHTIKNLTIAEGNEYCGLFGKINGAHVTIENLTIKDLNLNIIPEEAEVYAGGIIGFYSTSSSSASNTLTNCHVTGTIKMENYTHACIGGLAGFCSGISIENCTNSANITVNYGSVDNSANNGIGGIVGHARVANAKYSQTISSCLNTGDVTGPMNVGGIAGYTFAISCHQDNNSGRITFYDDYAGGIIGNANSSMIDFCSNIGAIKISLDGVDDINSLTTKYIGGIAGYSKVNLTLTSVYPFADNYNAGYIYGWNFTGGICGYANGWTYNNVNVAPIFDAGKYIVGCKSGSNIGCYPYKDGNNIKNDYYGGALYDKQMSLLTDSMNGMVFDKVNVTSELYTGQMLYDSIYHHFRTTLEINGPHEGIYNWIYNEGVYAVPNEAYKDFNVLASAVIKLDTSDRANDVNHQFRVIITTTNDEGPTITSASNNKICKIAGKTIGLVGTGVDTLRLQYKGMTREIPLVINSVDTLMFSGGSGASDDPYLISCLKDVKELAYYVNNHNHAKYTDKNWSYEKYFKVTDNIDEKFTGSIGIIGTDSKEFQGHFDGNGKRITIEPEDKTNAALFNIACEPATITSLEINGEIESCKNGAGIVCVGRNIFIDSCLNTTNIVATDTAGGIIAKAYKCNISNCGNNGLVKSTKLSGGIAGYSENCELGDVVNGGSILSAKVAGGLIGSSSSSSLENGVNYGYTGRTVAEIDGTNIGYTIGDKEDGNENNTYWNAQTNTIWDETWETKGMSSNSMMTDATFKSALGEMWNTSSDTTLPAPRALDKFEGKKLLVMPFSFTEKWNTLKDLNDTLKVPTKWFKPNQYQSLLGMMSYEDKLYPIETGEIIPQEFGADTLEINYYYNGISKRTNLYRKVVPIFISKGFLNGGKGTAADPYLIKNSNDFAKMVKAINEDFYCVDTIRNASWHKYFKQASEITETQTTPIGNSKRQRYEWSGFYDGNGNTIDVDIEGTDNVGLFTTITKGGSVKNLTITGSIKGSLNCGGITGYLKGSSTIENCNNKASIEGVKNIGGISGLSTSSNIKICYNNGTISGTYNIGGICGTTMEEGHNSDLLNLGNIIGEENVGGIVGSADSCDTRRAINEGIVTGKKDVGGIVGRYLWNGASNMLIFECMNYGYAENGAENNGAIVGENVNKGTNITLCFYNNQLTLAKAVNGADNEGFSSGLNTEDFLGSNLDAKNYYLSEYWEFGNKQYPMPSALKGDEVNVAKVPALIASNESFINIGTEFEVVTDNDVEWESKTGNLKVEGTKVSFNHSGSDTLVATLNGVSKQIPIFITNGLFSGGNGSENRPYRITCKRDMDDLAMYVNSNMLETDKTKNWSEGLYFSLENDIPEDSIITEIIGTPDTDDEIKFLHFGGVFEGHGHRMNVNISGEENNVGLFGYLSSGSKVDSVTIYGKIEGTSNVGGFAGYCEKGTISNCKNEASILGNNDAGGICGYITEGIISNCSNAGDITSKENKAGGIAGETSQATIEGCSNIAIIQSYTLNSYTGGICGRMNTGSNLSYCINSGLVTGENRIGGIVGEASNSTIKECIVTNEVIRTGYVEGADEGFVCGLPTGTTTMSNCYYDQQFCNLSNPQDKAKVEGRLTADLVGNQLNDLSESKWTFDSNMYPRPSNDTIALLASSTIQLITKDDNKNVSDEFNAYTYNNCQWVAQKPRVTIKNNKATLLSFGSDTLTAIYKKLCKKVAINITCITLHNLDTISGCDSVEYEGKWYNKDVTFNDTLISKVTGCDSLVGLKIEVKKSSIAPIQPTIYALDQYEYKGTVYNKDTTIITRETNAAGCDSIITQSINITNTKILRDTILAGCDSTLYNDEWYKADTLIEKHFKDSFDRDTLIKFIDVLVNYSKVEPTDTILGYDSLTYEGVIRYADVLISDTTLLETGCNHITNTQIKVGKTERKYFNKTFCTEGTLILSNGKKTVTENCVVNDTTLKTPEKLSISIYNVHIMHPKDTTIYLTSCDTIHFRDIIYDESIQIDSTFETDWCDSTVHYILTVLKPTIVEKIISNCYTTNFRGINYTEDAVISDTLKGQNQYGCDSIIVNKVIVKKATTDTLNTYGLEYKDIYGKHVTNDSTIVDTLVNAAGCDSFLVTKVHITHFRSDTLTEYGCDSLMYEGTWFKKSTTIMTGKYDPDGVWDDVDQEEKQYLQQRQIIHINIGEYQEYKVNIDSCDQITFRNKVYTQDTVVRDSFISRSGCDSVMVYTLKLHKPETEGHLEITGCGSAEWNGETFEADTTIEQHTTTKWGCDSTCIVNIIVRHPDELTVYEQGCNFVEYDGETFYRDTIVTRVYTNKGGCDSTVHADIAIYKPSYNTITYEGEYDVTYNGRKYTRSTVIRDTLVNYHGCDSILTIAIVVTKSLDYPLIVNKYDYMLLCNNNIGNDRYTKYQWYKNGQSIYGENKAYYSETEGNKLAGCYQVYVTTDDGREYFSEEVCIEEEKILKLYPNPVAVGEDINIDYEFTDVQKKGLYLDVYNSTGTKVFHNEPTTFPIVIPGQTETGYYFILITTGEDKNLGTKFIVK